MESQLQTTIVGGAASIIVAMIGVWGQAKAQRRRSTHADWESGRSLIIFGSLLALGLAVTSFAVGLNTVRATQPYILRGYISLDPVAVKTDAGGRKYYEGRLIFNEAFAEPPALMVALKHLAIYEGRLDIDVEYDEPSATGFTYRFRVAQDTKPTGVTAAWIAVGRHK